MKCFPLLQSPGKLQDQPILILNWYHRVFLPTDSPKTGSTRSIRTRKDRSTSSCTQVHWERCLLLTYKAPADILDFPFVRKRRRKKRKIIKYFSLKIWTKNSVTVKQCPWRWCESSRQLLIFWLRRNVENNNFSAWYVVSFVHYFFPRSVCKWLTNVDDISFRRFCSTKSLVSNTVLEFPVLQV